MTTPSTATVPRNVGPACRALIDVVIAEATRRNTPVDVSAQYDLTGALIYVYTTSTPTGSSTALPRFVAVSVPISVFAGGSTVPAATRSQVIAGLLG